MILSIERGTYVSLFCGLELINIQIVLWLIKSLTYFVCFELEITID
ncbi:hypothetical protein BML2526_26320 [Providencia rettgeri]|nr:hypothetical protein BML2496_25520 [Providencia rettgeri]BBV00980.1 hypothetical protein BML2526_26320 [Providencia rettgeri]BBV03834.1 hypothetical protein BML2531_16100 [Providencia rettgeri]BBV12058.1 hypothetical protein BML2576_15170 [Providencia rettgeri]BDH18186.1 hypothetical protein PrNR1418_14770 [Providencia rettgeri]